MADRFLPCVPGPKVERMLNAAPGNEIASGNFDSPESSAALAANTFGFFIKREGELPPLPGCGDQDWPASSLALEKTVRFPWKGGRHPVLDVLVTTPSAIIGIESKRFEPLRAKSDADFSDAYWRQVWGDRMKGYESIRDRLHDDKGLYLALNAAQLVKHAFGLRTQVHRGGYKGLTPILFYLYAEPEYWPKNGVPVCEEAKARHRNEIERFSIDVAGDEVRFVGCTYRSLLASWKRVDSPKIQAHAEAVMQRFSP